MDLCYWLIVMVILGLSMRFGESSEVERAKCDRLQDTVDQQANEIETLTTEVEVLKQAHADKLQKIEDKIYKLETKDTLLENSISSLKEKARRNFVGFHAYHDRFYHQIYSVGETVIFPNVITNVGPKGSLYDPKTGVFHCKVTGYYFFTATVLGNGKAYGTITVGAVEVATMYAPQKADTGTASAVVLCQDEDVSVKVIGVTSDYHCCSYTTFSGHLLQSL